MVILRGASYICLSQASFQQADLGFFLGYLQALFAEIRELDRSPSWKNFKDLNKRSIASGLGLSISSVDGQVSYVQDFIVLQANRALSTVSWILK